jgi:hypothetical protein
MPVAVGEPGARECTHLQWDHASCIARFEASSYDPEEEISTEEAMMAWVDSEHIVSKHKAYLLIHRDSKGWRASIERRHPADEGKELPAFGSLTHALEHAMFEFWRSE